MRRRRAVWLLDTPDPTGAAVLALRRATVLRDRLDSTLLSLSGPGTPVPAGAPLHGIARSTGLGGEVRIARADIVVTTSERTLASAAPRVRATARLVHVVHTDPRIALASEPIMRTLPRVAAVLVPAATDPVGFAVAVGLRAEQVIATDDFTLAADTLLGTATPQRVLAVGGLGAAGGALDLARAFRHALPRLPGWQLRVVGDGARRAELQAWVDEHALGTRIEVAGPRHDIAAEYAAAGVLVHLGRREGNGLPVLEALTAGIPVIGTADVPAVRRYVRDGVNGTVLERTDPATVADALVALADPGLRRRLAAGARSEPSGLLDADGRARLVDLVDHLPAAGRPVPIRSVR